MEQNNRLNQLLVNLQEQTNNVLQQQQQQQFSLALLQFSFKQTPP